MGSLDGEYMSVGSLEPKFWQSLCRTLGRTDLIEGTVLPEDPENVKRQLREIFRTRTKEEWVRVFSKADACVQPVLDLKEALLEDPQIREREMVVEVEMPLQEGIRVRQMGTAIKLSETPCEYHFAGYPLGYHTREIVEQLGMDYQKLSDKGVFE